MRKKVIYKEDAAVEDLIEALAIKKDSHFTPEQCSALHYGLSLGAEVERYADPVYDGGQLRELFEAQSAGIDTRLMEDPTYSFGQMHEIAIGLKDGVGRQRLRQPILHQRAHVLDETRHKPRHRHQKTIPTFLRACTPHPPVQRPLQWAARERSAPLQGKGLQSG